MENFRQWNSRRMAGRRNCSAPFEKLCLLLLTLIAWPSLSEAQSPTAACPLNFTILNQYPTVANQVGNSDTADIQCTAINSGLQLVLSNYLRESGFFLVPQGTSTACVNAYQTQLQSQGSVGFDISKTCPSNALLSERGTDVCHNIQSTQNFTNLVPAGQLDSLNISCSQSLSETTCGLCNTAVQVTSNQISVSNNVSCTAFVSIYTAGIVSNSGPLDPTVASCLFFIGLSSAGKQNKNLLFIGIGVGGMLLLCLLGALIFYFRYRHVIAANRKARKLRTQDLLSASSVPKSSIHWFDIDELKRATRNFHRENLLGTGGYGNVYKGTLLDGTVVAVKRFKNCSPAGDADFVHEVEMISSVKHTHLVGIQGCCVTPSGIGEGHQRMIVYDYMPNGSLQDHLFSPKPGRITLNWPTRSKIAIGMARGLAYLHHDALPAIFHRDIKASNILLDTDFSARLADFGLAKFTPEGVSHISTRWVGTLGYAAPEYAVYGQLTEKSDVYSFGMVVLELVTGKKALSSPTDDPPRTLLSDWAWPLVRQGKWKSIIDPRMEDDGLSCGEIETFILVGLLCAHPQVHYRPSIDQALKMLESRTLGLPNIPDRPLPLTSNPVEIQEALSRESREHRDHSSRTGFSSYSVSTKSSSQPFSLPDQSPSSTFS